MVPIRLPSSLPKCCSILSIFFVKVCVYVKTKGLNDIVDVKNKSGFLKVHFKTRIILRKKKKCKKHMKIARENFKQLKIVICTRDLAGGKSEESGSG